MIRTTNEAWINDKYYYEVGFLRAKDCNNDKTNFKKSLQEELGENIELITDIQEGYYRIQKSDFFASSEYGEYCYMPCEKGKGATLYYFAAYELVKENQI
ncbi:MAG: hypothetical protein HFJ45_02500 [Clostridia bacterium]|nr:hypothetical protein [Clostridia bacterium]